MDRTILRHLILSSVLVASRGYVLPEVTTAPPDTPSAPAMVNEAILGSGEASKLLPLSIFLGGQQLFAEPRNSSGIRFSDGMYILAVPIDLSGHAGTRETFEACFISEVSLYIHGRKLGPGVYGLRVDGRHRFIIMDIAARSILAADSVRDLRPFRPRPLQILASPSAGHYRLYLGREYVVLSRADRSTD
jgi:hypothetical protein